MSREVNSPPHPPPPPPKQKDGCPLSGLQPSYNFNCPTSLRPQVLLIWQASCIVSFYPQYTLNLFTWPPGQGNFPPHLDTWKNAFESVTSQDFLPMTRQILKKFIIKVSKFKVQDTTEVIKKDDRLWWIYLIII